MKFNLITSKFYITGVKILLVSIVVIIIVSVYQSQLVIKTGKKITNSEELLQLSKKIQGLALDNESNFRSYVLTGRKTILAPFEKSRKEVFAAFKNLQSLPVDDEGQKINLDSLYFYVKTRNEFRNTIIANYEANGVYTSMKMAEMSDGKLYIDRIRILVEKIQDTESTMLTKYKRANENSIKNLQRILSLIVADILLLMAVFIQKTRADNAEKVKVAAALKKLNDELEQRVKERTEELHKKEELFRALVENNEGIILLIDERLNVIFRSSSTTAVTGWQFAENAKIAGTDYLHPDDIRNIEALMAETLANPGKAIPVSLRVKHKHGQYIWLEGVVKNMIHDPAVRGIVTNLRDISERKKDEIRIRSAIERYDILSNATSDTIWDWDIVSNTMLYNDGITKTFGYLSSEVEDVVDWWNEKLYPDDLKKVTEALEEVFENGLEKFQLTYQFRCADGSYKYIFDRAFVIFDESGNPCRMIGAMQDITYQVEEEIRISKAIMDAQEQERGFISAELHDNVNQLLASSLLAISMVKADKVKTKQTFEFLQMAREHTLSAVEEVRKLSHRLAPATFDNTTLKDAFEHLLQSFNLNKRFSIKLDFDTVCNDVNSDMQINLYRILQEQIKNIVKYSEANKIEITVTQAQDAVKMRIFDNGKGFNVKTAKKGIGLNNIKKRAESFSGKFILNSAKGKGCEILLELPLAKAG